MRCYEILFFTLPYCHQNRLREYVKFSVSFCYLSDFEALQRFQEHVKFARTNSLLQIKVFSFADKRSSYRVTFP